jgi:5-methylcytosine-specific restriction endonuclease McrA
MKRTPLRRFTPLKTKTTLKRGEPIKRARAKAVPTSLYKQVLARDLGCVARDTVRQIRCYGRIDPHHVLPRSRGGKDTLDDLISLCRAHHEWVHDHPAESYELGLLRRSGS